MRTDEKPGALAEDRLDAVIGEMRRAFQWDDSLRHLALAREWESRTSILYKLDGGQGSPSVVLKVGKDWTPTTGASTDDLRSLEDIFAESDKVNINLPKVRGWSESPACVCFDFIEGEDFSQRLSRRAGYQSAEVEEAMAECGAAIGLFHSAGLEAAASVDMDEMRRLVAMGRKVLIDQDVIMSMDLTGLVSRKYGDFAPYNIRLTDDGRVWILDQPSSHAYAPIHRDVAYFLYRVERRLGRYEPDDPAEMKATQAHLEDVFLSAYANTGPSPLDSPQDKTLFATHSEPQESPHGSKAVQPAPVPGGAGISASRRRLASTGHIEPVGRVTGLTDR